MMLRLVLVGGFLGAGKTTLLWNAAKRLRSRGLAVGLITNDQAPQLVDTALLTRAGVSVTEVSGSCFCCDYQGLLDAIDELRNRRVVDVVIAEPVGSCTDLSATIVQPLKDKLRDRLVVAPLTVLVDPARMADLLEGGTAGLHPGAAYILRKQMEEADILVLAKADVLEPGEAVALRDRVRAAHPGATVRTLSSRTGEGLEEWLEEVMTRSDAGLHLAEVDYDLYAEGEAALGWLNATLTLEGDPAGWNAFVRRLLEGLAERFRSSGAAVGHVKVLLDAGGTFVVGNLTGAAEAAELRGSAGLSPRAELTINARVEMPPGDLERSVRWVLDAAAADGIGWKEHRWRCLSPGRPEPTHRYGFVVEPESR
ncbi:MAG: cobalamin synthesis protein P47K [Acidobacteria bacterium]|nr:cobalamin synthesis protein P47K [Acidobacteriota bacterium]